MAQLPDKSRNTAVSAFLDKLSKLPAVRPAGRGRLIFAVDATASRQPAWDRACHLQSEMFQATEGLGGLSVQLCFWRGYREFAATPFLSDTKELARRMSGVSVLGGQTQILRCLEHALGETTAERVNAVILVGDALEEAIDPICHIAAQLGLRGTPVFCFQEGGDAAVEAGFRQIAKLSGGAWAPFDLSSAAALRDLLRAVAVFAAGGRAALARLPGQAAARIAGQLPAPGKA
jgi:hypothetical protein